MLFRRVFNPIMCRQIPRSFSAAKGCSLELSDIQKEIQELAWKFTKEEIIPVAVENERSGKYPWDIINKAWSVSLLNKHISQHCDAHDSYQKKFYGDMEANIFDACLIDEELAYDCTGIVIATVCKNFEQTPVVIAGTKEQQKKYFGRLVEEPHVTAFGVTDKRISIR